MRMPRVSRRYRRRRFSRYRGLKPAFLSMRHPFPVKSMVNLGHGFPHMLKMKMHYTDSYIIGGLGGAITQQKWNLNGLYDFDFTGGGHQPYYFDQLMALYDHYTVVSAKVTCVVMNVSSAPLMVGAFINDDTTTIPSSINILEAPSSKWKVVPYGTSAKPTYFTHKWSATKFFNHSRQALLANTDLQGDATHNPNEASVLNFYSTAIDGVSPPSAQMVIRAEWVVIFKELKDIAGS